MHPRPTLLDLALEAARRAPSADNCQPFRFRLTEDGFRIHYEPERAAHPLNPGDEASHLALGCLIESVDTAVRAVGARATLRPGPSPLEPAIVLAAGPTRGPLELEEALAHRATDRRPYHPGALPRAALTLHGRRRGPCQLHLLVRRPDPALAQWLATAEAQLFRRPADRAAVLHWLRATDAAHDRARDGLTWRNLGLPLLVARTLALTGGLAAHAPGRLTATAWSAVVRHQLATAAAVGLITTDAHGPTALIEAGRLAMEAWLELTRLGLAFQPLTLGSLAHHSEASGAAPPRPGARLERGRALIEQAFRTGALPVWMFRTGHQGPLPQVARSHRLPLSRLILPGWP